MDLAVNKTSSLLSVFAVTSFSFAVFCEVSKVAHGRQKVLKRKGTCLG